MYNSLFSFEQSNRSSKIDFRHHLLTYLLTSSVWVIVADAQNNDVCRAFFARWMPFMFLFDGTIQRDLLSYSLVSQYTLNHGRWYHINHNSLVSSVLSIYLFIFLPSADHTECFVHMFHSRKNFCLYSALHPPTGNSAEGAQRNSYCSWLASPCRCNWSWCYTSTL